MLNILAKVCADAVRCDAKTHKYIISKLGLKRARAVNEGVHRAYCPDWERCFKVHDL